MATHANGFCFLNDLVFAIRRLRSLGIQRIAYVDLDAHHCDGVESACNDDEFLSVVDQIVLPAIQRFSPEALIIQGGADALLDDPLSRLSLSNTALWQILSNLLELSGRVILTGGGGYNPWTVARLWTGFWAIMSGRQLPYELDAVASLILRDLHWTRMSKPHESVFQYFHDVPNKGGIRSKMRDLMEHLKRLHSL